MKGEPCSKCSGQGTAEGVAGTGHVDRVGGLSRYGLHARGVHDQSAVGTELGHDAAKAQCSQPFRGLDN